MSDVSFYYQKLPKRPSQVLLIAFSGVPSDIQRWEAIIDKPFEDNAAFWSINSGSNYVINKSCVN